MTPTGLVRTCLAMLSATAGLIHLAAAPSHFEVSPVHGSFFLVIGLFQVVSAGLIARRGSAGVLRAVGAGNLGIAGVWVMSRTTGVPIGPAPWTPEAVGFADAACTVLEALLVSGSLLLLSARGRELVESIRLRHARLTLVAGASALVVLTAFSVGALGSEEHGHAAASHAHVAGARHAHSASVEHDETGSVAGHAHPEPAGSPGAHDHAAAPHAGPHTPTAPGTPAHTHAAPRPGGAAHHSHGTEGQPPVPPAPATQAIGPAPDDHRTTVRYGPFVLPPASLGGLLHASLVQPALVKPCSNCYITSITPDLVYGDGTPANLDTGPMLHHAVWTRPLVPDATCGAELLGLVGERFFASGNERTPWLLPTGFGYQVGDDPWTLITEIMNHSEQLRIVFVELDVTYRDASDPGIKPVKPVWMDVADCRTSEYHVDAGSSETTWTWTSSVTGRIVGSAGHLHDGGTRISLRNETTGSHLCTSAAGYGTKPAYGGTLDSMTACTWDALGTVRAGEVLGLHAYYERSAPADDVMGIMLVFVHPTDDLAGGMPAPEAVTQPTPVQSPPPVHTHH